MQFILRYLFDFTKHRKYSDRIFQSSLQWEEGGDENLF